jgi:hypothetical protein
LAPIIISPQRAEGAAKGHTVAMERRVIL